MAFQELVGISRHLDCLVHGILRPNSIVGMCLLAFPSHSFLLTHQLASPSMY